MTAGLIIVVPLAITFWVLRLVFNLMDGFLGPVIEDRIGRDVPGIGIVAMLLLVYLTGQLWEFSNLGKRMIGAVQKWLLSIPIVGAVYSPARRLIDSFSGTSESGFKRVVLIEYPKAGAWMIGFLTATTMTKDGEMGVVYVPTAPTPNSGWVGVVPIDGVYDVDMTVQQAMTMVLSGGIVTPGEIAMTGMRPTTLSAATDGAQAASQLQAGATSREVQSE
jgi:uncharacterized membrane protein